MEALAGVSLAANVVQFIDFSYTLVSRGRKIHSNGSLSEHSDLENVTSALVGYNRRLRESLESRQSLTDGPTEDERVLESIATDCTKVAEQLLQRLQRLKYSGKRKLWKSFRSALKSVWSKAEIDGIATALATYRQQLILQHQEVALFSTCNLVGSLDKKIDPLSHQLESLSRLLTAAQVPQRAELPGTNSHVGNNISTANRDCTSEGAVPSKPPHSPMSCEQFKILQDMIGQVLVRVQSGKSSHRSVSPIAISAAEGSSSLHGLQGPHGYEGVEVSTAREEASEFSKCINELCCFASKKGTALFSEDAHLMIKSLDKILATVEHHTDTEQSTLQNRKRERALEDNDPRGFQTVRSVKRIRGLLNSAQCIAVNHPAIATRPTLVEGKYDSNSNYITSRRPEGTIGLLERKRQLRRPTEIDGNDVGDLVFESFSATFDYIPSGQMPKFKITAGFQQYVRLQNFTSLSPILTYSAMVPDDAAIIRCVMANDVSGMLNLLEQGLASLTDCDSQGRPLLYYAVGYTAPAVCKYLIDQKADVDVYCVDEGSIIPVLGIRGNDSELEPVQLANMLACRRIIIEGGADPTLHAYGESSVTHGPVFWRALLENSFEYVKMILDLAGEFFDMQDRWHGWTSVFLVIEAHDNGLNPDILNLLVRRGADVLERKLSTGDTCLHIAMKALRQKSTYRRGTKSAAFLVILIRAGLEIFDENYDGVTPWDLARDLCVVQRKIFEDALTECEIDSTGLFIDGEECPGVIHHGDDWKWIDNRCWCDTNSQAISDRENSHHFESMNQYDDDSDEVASERSESMSDNVSNSNSDQRIEEPEDDTAGGLSGYFKEAAEWTPLSRLNFEVTGQDAYQDVPLYQESTSSSSLPTMEFLFTSSQHGHIWSPTTPTYQHLYTQEYTSRTPATPDVIQARPLHALFYQHSPHISPNPLPADPKHHYTYSSTLAWASDSHLNSENIQTMVDVTRHPSTTAAGRVEIAMGDIRDPLREPI